MQALKMTNEQHFKRYKQIMDAHLEHGGLNPEDHRTISENDMTKFVYEFTYEFQGSFKSYIYEMQENDEFRAYVFAEVTLAYLPKDVDSFIIENALMINLSIASAIRIYMKPNRQMVIGFRMPADALSDSYLTELLDRLAFLGNDLLKRFKSNKGAALIGLERNNPPKCETE